VKASYRSLKRLLKGLKIDSMDVCLVWSPNLKFLAALIISFLVGCALRPEAVHPCGRGNSAISDA
jgi:hypothetical protein